METTWTILCYIGIKGYTYIYIYIYIYWGHMGILENEMETTWTILCYIGIKGCILGSYGDKGKMETTTIYLGGGGCLGWFPGSRALTFQEPAVSAALATSKTLPE